MSKQVLYSYFTWLHFVDLNALIISIMIVTIFVNNNNLHNNT